MFAAELLYYFATAIYFRLIWLAAFFSSKAAKWQKGRRNIFQDMKTLVVKRRSHQRTLWMHFASLGEFEQGKPVMEQFRRQHPDWFLWMTFFSPSGYEQCKNYTLADAITYLPADTSDNVARFLDIVKPDLVIFVKYEFWYGYLKNLHRRGIPLVLISALFRGEQPFFRWYGWLHRHMLNFFSIILVQDEKSLELLKNVSEVQVAITGDTRVSRVSDISRQVWRDVLIENFCKGKSVLVAGSTWSKDENLLKKLRESPISDGWVFIIAPHEVSARHLYQLRKLLKTRCILYSELKHDPEKQHTADVLIIDHIGSLAFIYRYGDVAYIGGGFGKGIHNTLEPAAYHLPIIFGPSYRKFEEARYFVQYAAAFCIHHFEDLLGVMNFLKNLSNRKKAAKVTYEYVEKHKDATSKTMQYINSFV